MAGTIQFNREYISFGDDVEDYEKTPDIVVAWEEMLARWGYPCGGQIGAKFSAQWLQDRERPENDPETLDLLFLIPDQPYIEIILNSGTSDARYGGWLSGSAPVDVTDEIVNGYRVLVTTLSDGSRQRHEYDPVTGEYGPAGSATALPIAAARRRGLRVAV
ncbi:MAG: hypothetical protein AAF293_00920 [Pseudomonadota bacterium]